MVEPAFSHLSVHSVVCAVMDGTVRRIAHTKQTGSFKGPRVAPVPSGFDIIPRRHPRTQPPPLIFLGLYRSAGPSATWPQPRT